MCLQRQERARLLRDATSPASAHGWYRKATAPRYKERREGGREGGREVRSRSLVGVVLHGENAASVVEVETCTRHIWAQVVESLHCTRNIAIVTNRAHPLHPLSECPP